MKEKIYVLDLFSGIGGFALAAEIANAMADTRLFGQEEHEKQTTGIEQCRFSPIANALADGESEQDIGQRQGGFQSVTTQRRFVSLAHSEIEPFACAVYHRHFPDSVCFGGVQNVSRDSLLERCGVLPDVVCGGFPCQPHSCAGKRLASADDRDLWGECRRILRDVRPRFALFENVRGLLSSESGLFFNRVLSEMAEIRYSCQWQVVPASAVGAPHKRERVWMLCWDELSDRKDQSEKRELCESKSIKCKQRSAGCGTIEWPAIDGHWPSRPGEAQHGWEPPRVVVDTKGQRGGRDSGGVQQADGRQVDGLPRQSDEPGEGDVGNANQRQCKQHGGKKQDERELQGLDCGCGETDGQRQVEPALGVLPDGLPSTVGGTMEENAKKEEESLWPTPSVCGNYNRKGCSKTSGDGLATKVSMSMRSQILSERLQSHTNEQCHMSELPEHGTRHNGCVDKIDDCSESLWRTPSAEEAGAKVETLYTKDGQPARPGERAYRLQPDGRLVLQSVTINQQVEMVDSNKSCEDYPEVFNRTSQLKAAGNSIVPEVAAIFMHAILKTYQTER